jgi:hypothetical protein
LRPGRKKGPAEGAGVVGSPSLLVSVGFMEDWLGISMARAMPWRTIFKGK